MTQVQAAPRVQTHQQEGGPQSSPTITAMPPKLTAEKTRPRMAPAPWKTHWCEQHNSPYYHNPITGITTWDRPEDPQAPTETMQDRRQGTPNTGQTTNTQPNPQPPTKPPMGQNQTTAIHPSPQPLTKPPSMQSQNLNVRCPPQQQQSGKATVPQQGLEQPPTKAKPSHSQAQGTTSKVNTHPTTTTDLKCTTPLTTTTTRQGHAS